MSDLDQNRSMLNPTDVAAMGATGQIRPDMTVREFLESQGVDVEGPVQQLRDLAGKQTQTATALGKARVMGAQRPAPRMGAPATPAQPAPARPPQGGGLQRLMGR